MSYALDSKDSDAKARDQAFNHFVVFDAYDLIACHDFQVSEISQSQPDTRICSKHLLQKGSS